MRRSTPGKADPAFLDEKTARKQTERQVLLDALSGGLQAEAIEWTAGNAIAPETTNMNSVAAENLPDIAEQDALREAHHLVQRKLGCFMVRMQQFESLLKAAIVDAELVHTTELSGKQHQQQRIKKFETKSLGLLVEETTKTVFQLAGSAKEAKEPPDENRLRFHFQAKISLEPEDLEQIKTELQDLVNRRNLVVHHLIEKFDMRNTLGCEAAVQCIDESYAVVDRVYAKLTEMLTGSLSVREQFSALLLTKEIREFLTTGQFPKGDIHVSA